MNISFFKKFKVLFTLSLLLFLYTFLCAITYVNAVSSDISDSVFRLHIIANSDSEQDQNLKYIVRNNLIEYMNDICADSSSKEEAICIAKEHEQDFYNIAKQTIIENGFSYDVDIEIGKCDFPTKNYGDISLPAGIYDALRVKIGNASGQNWWCVMFPPLCFVDVSSGIVPDESKEIIKEDLSDEEYGLISGEEKASIKFKFKLMEWFQGNNILTAKNE